MVEASKQAKREGKWYEIFEADCKRHFAELERRIEDNAWPKTKGSDLKNGFFNRSRETW